LGGDGIAFKKTFWEGIIKESFLKNIMKRNKILIVEDEEILLGVLQKKLSAEGFEVAMARNGEEGLEKIREIKPDLVLLDIIMPKKDGFAVLEEMAAEKEMKNIPVIMISNSGQELELEKALKMGAKDFFIKIGSLMQSSKHGYCTKW